MRSRNERTEYLLRQIGEIDDRLLHEAEAYKPVRQKRYDFGLLAACLVLACFLVIALPLLRSDMKDQNQVDMEVSQSLDQVLSSNTLYATNLESFDGLSYIGAPKLVWKNDESGKIYMCYLNKQELARLQGEMGKGEQVESISPTLTCHVWLLDGDGKVLSPYLKDSPGNEGCTVFDYNAEIIPTETFVECVSEIIGS